MKAISIKKITTTAFFAALTCLSTFIVLFHIPATGGYVHLGDCFVLLSGFLLGPLWGGLAAAIGSALTDIFAGAAAYAPATFFIKWGVAALGAFIVWLFGRNGKKVNILHYILGSVAGEIVMVGGYFFYELILVDYAGASAGIIPNIIQASCGIVLASALIIPIKKINYIKRFFE